MKHVTIRVKTPDWDPNDPARNIPTPPGRIHRLIAVDILNRAETPCDILAIEDAPQEHQVTVTQPDGTTHTTWHDTPSDAYQAAKTALLAGNTVQLSHTPEDTPKGSKLNDLTNVTGRNLS